VNAYSSPRWVLVIEDDHDDELITRRVFGELAGSNCIRVARDGIEALDTLRSHDYPALVVLDLKLPRLSGVDVLMEIRDDERLRTIPVVILTSSKELSDIGACYELGCNAYVEKPLDFEEFTRTISKVFDFWLNVNMTLPLTRSSSDSEVGDAVMI
jgi:two-component system response regulator